MSKTTTLPPPNLTLRRIFMRDLPSIIEIEQQPTMRWPLRDLRAVLQSSNAAGWVAEINGRVVGFLIYVVGLQPAHGRLRDEIAAVVPLGGAERDVLLAEERGARAGVEKHERSG